MDGVKGQDLVVLFKLLSIEEQEREDEPAASRTSLIDEAPHSVRGLASLLGISKSEVSASIHRSISTGLAVKDHDSGRVKPNGRNLHRFVVHGVKFVFPARPGAMTRGIPTAFAAPVLKGVLISGGDYIYVWPAAEGRDIGQAVRPVFKSVSLAVLKDERLYKYLALVDAIRLGNQREAGLAEEMLADGLIGR